MKPRTYETRLRHSRILCAVCAACCVAGVILLLCYPLPSERTNDMLIAMLCGVTGGMGGSVWRTSRILRDPERLRRTEIADHDERSRALTARASQITLCLLFCAGFVAMVYFVFTNPSAAVALAWVMGATLIVWLLLCWALARRC